MRAKILKIEKKISRYSTTLPFFYIYFRGEDGKSYKTCASPIYRNYQRWHALAESSAKSDIWLDNLSTKIFRGETIVDADSAFTVCPGSLINQRIEGETAPQLPKTMELFPVGCQSRLKRARQEAGV